MKTKILFLFLSLSCLGSYAQKSDSINPALSKGSLSIGGNIGGGWAHGRLYGNISPSIGLFIKDKWEIGLRLSNDFSMTDKFQFSHYNFKTQLFTRKYFNSGLFLHFDVFAGSGKYKSTDENNELTPNFKIKSLGFAPGIGYLWFLNKHVALEGLLKYNLSYTKSESLLTDPQPFENDFQNNFKISIGLKIFLGNNKK